MRTLRELLTGREIVALPPSATTLEAATLMHQHHVGAILVVDGEGTPQGIFSERDLMKRVVVGGLVAADVPVEQKMTRELFVARVDDTVTDMAEAMQERHIRHLPVVDEDGHVVGLLGLRDLLRELLRSKNDEVAALTDYIQQPPE